VKLLSWNIQQGRGADGIVSLQRIADEIEKSQADIICLQEISRGFTVEDGTSDKPDQCAQLKAYFPGFDLAFGAGVNLVGAPGAPRREFGNVILSRWNIEMMEPHLLPWPYDQAAKKSMRRSAIDCTVNTPVGILRVITTHLEYHSALQRTHQLDYLSEIEVENRRRQIAGINCSDPDPYHLPELPAETIICGDFNMLPESPEYQHFMASNRAGQNRFVDVWHGLHPGVPHPGTCGVSDVEQWPEGPHCRDFIFVSDGLFATATRYEVDQQTIFSDHQPTLVDFSDLALRRAL